MTKSISEAAFSFYVQSHWNRQGVAGSVKIYTDKIKIYILNLAL